MASLITPDHPQDASDERCLVGLTLTASRELQHARQRVELEKFKTDLQKSSTKAEATEQLFKARAGDEVKKLREAVAEQDATNRKIIPIED